MSIRWTIGGASVKVLDFGRERELGEDSSFLRFYFRVGPKIPPMPVAQGPLVPVIDR